MKRVIHLDRSAYLSQTMSANQPEAADIVSNKIPNITL